MADPFQPKFVDLVRNYSSTVGTGNFSLGPAVNGFTSFVAACQVGDSFYYSAIGVDKPAEREVGRGTLLAGGIIQRDPINGAKTNFTSGTKSVALIAASEWFSRAGALMASVSPLGQSLASAPSASDARGVLALGSASTLDGDTDAALTSNSDSKVPTQKAVKAYVDARAGGAAGALLAGNNLSDVQDASAARANLGISGGFNVKWFGAKGNSNAAGSSGTDDTAAIQAAIDYVNSIGGGTVYFPEGWYKVANLTACANLRLVGRGATLVSTSTVSAPTLSIPNPGVTIESVHFKLAGGAAPPWHVNVTGAYCTIEDCIFEKDEGTGGYQGYFRWGADNLRFVNNRTQGSNGFYVEASNMLFANSRFVGKADADDGIALKAIQGVVHSIRISGCHFENHADMVAIGSEIGVAGADDPTFSRGVRGVTISGCTAVNCSFGLYIKPGGGAYDYRNGFVQDVLFDNCVIEDVTGTRFQRAVAITPGFGGKVENVRVGNCIVRGRSCGTEAGGHKRAIDLWVLNQGAGTNPKISNVEIAARIVDPFDGAAFGTAGVPGYPIVNLASVQDSMGGGNISNVRLAIEGNGCSENGILIGAGIDGAVSVERAIITNANAGGATGAGGIYSGSAYSLGEYSFTLGGGSNFNGPGVITPKLPKQLSASSLLANPTTTRGDAAPVGISGGLAFSGGNLTITGAVTPSSVTTTGTVTSSAAPIAFKVNTATGLDGRIDLQIAGAQVGYLGTLGDASGILLGVPFGKIINLTVAGTNKAVLSSSAFNLATGVALQSNGIAVINGAGMLQAAAFPALSGDVTTTAGSLTTSIGANKVTRAMLAAAAGPVVLGATAAGNVSDLTTLPAAVMPALTGDVTMAAGTTVTALASATVVAKMAAQAIAPSSIAATGTVTSSGGGVGYAAGAGGTVTQATSKSTGVTLNKLCGQITTSAAALAASTGVSFTVTNSQVAATDTIDLVLASGNAGAGTYNYQVDKVGAGSFVIWLKNISAGSLSEALVFNFSVKKAVNA